MELKVSDSLRKFRKEVLQSNISPEEAANKFKKEFCDSIEKHGLKDTLKELGVNLLPNKACKEELGMNIGELLDKGGAVEVETSKNQGIDGVIFIGEGKIVERGIVYIFFKEKDNTPKRINFNITHELGHLLTDQNLESYIKAGVSSVKGRQTAKSVYSNSEQKSDRFAAEYLIPTDRIILDLKDKDFYSLASGYRASYFAVAQKIAHVSPIPLISYVLKGIKDPQDEFYIEYEPYQYFSDKISKKMVKFNSYFLNHVCRRLFVEEKRIKIWGESREEIRKEWNKIERGEDDMPTKPMSKDFSDPREYVKEVKKWDQQLYEHPVGANIKECFRNKEPDTITHGPFRIAIYPGKINVFIFVSLNNMADRFQLFC